MEAFRYCSTGFPSLFFQIFSLLMMNLEKVYYILVMLLKLSFEIVKNVLQYSWKVDNIIVDIYKKL